MKLKTTAVMLTSIASLAATANAAVVLGDIIAIDFGATTTTTANYNHSTHATNTGDVADLIRLSDGAATGVSFTLDGSSQDNINYVAGNGGNTTDATIYADGIIANTSNGASGNPTSLTLTFNNLDDSLAYDLVVGSTRADTQANPQNFEVNWTAGGNTVLSSGIAPDGYVSFNGLKSTGGELVITVDGTNQYSPIAQLELTAVVPEPSSAALLGLGGLALILRRRK
ncbi:PEP-CTERM sorting domain-containing protein [Verrucomicrobiaceae bacterium R5-34]|uniref:PEP-CTERM sorting domain-containing protein n=1 Tax=Oceaniferula flava TaxID=2800421 RepID=A0AAE2V7T0_9BACT|nr:PEP-CTERM sorting domain-containing protein [Oceaniferula flavus]MBK1831423.1 PEP-CTERM sorting domain-containing protein [Verrucomicrobiaceae bacterium R5-34]MBK1854337.1 PEP-CTERM sorting domain-containing protein [Oceaniferula flavus]MBM1135643.1 PEP-CTERM sorting domain-containing protein [Oceaniferula flavus]